jgi:ribosomal protein L37AE/L43A
MVTHGGRCPFCENRTTPGVGARAGFWICLPCKTVFDNYGQVYQPPVERAMAEPGGALRQLGGQGPKFQVVPRIRARRNG